MSCKGKGKVCSRTDHEGPYGYRCTLSLTSAIVEGGWSTPRLGRFIPGKTRYPLYRGLTVPQGLSVLVLKISPPLAFDPRTVQPVAIHYID